MMRKIVIEIPEDEGFDWIQAVDLWKKFMKDCKTGHNYSPLYVWYDISPTVITTPLSDSVKDKCNFKVVKKKEIECLERKMYEMKKKIKTLKGEL